MGAHTEAQTTKIVEGLRAERVYGGVGGGHREKVRSSTNSKFSQFRCLRSMLHHQREAGAPPRNYVTLHVESQAQFERPICPVISAKPRIIPRIVLAPRRATTASCLTGGTLAAPNWMVEGLTQSGPTKIARCACLGESTCRSQPAAQRALATSGTTSATRKPKKVCQPQSRDRPRVLPAMQRSARFPPT